MEEVTVRPIQRERMLVSIIGISPLIVNRWSEKAKQQIRDKQQKPGSRKLREPKKPKEDFKAAAYHFNGGGYGWPAGGIKKAMMAATHKDLGFAKVALAKALFIVPDDAASNLIKIRCKGGPKMREDVVRVANGQPDLRYRPEFQDWSMDLTIDYDAELIGPEVIVNLLQRAGFGVGLGEWRPSSPKSSGEYGRFEVEEKKSCRGQRRAAPKRRSKSK